jgi:hypothetical protein
VVLLGLELVPYRALPSHDDAWLAARLGLTGPLLRECLERLVDAGQVRFDGTHYRPLDVLDVDLRRPASGSALRRHWASVALARLERDEPGLYSYNLFTVSEVDLEHLEDLQRAHYRAVRALVGRSAPAERVVLMNLQLVPLDQRQVTDDTELHQAVICPSPAAAFDARPARR